MNFRFQFLKHFFISAGSRYEDVATLQNLSPLLSYIWRACSVETLAHSQDSFCSCRVVPEICREMATLPRLHVPIGRLPQRLKDRTIQGGRARIEVLRRIVTKLVREERIEIQWNRAVEARPYVERVSEWAES